MAKSLLVMLVDDDDAVRKTMARLNPIARNRLFIFETPFYLVMVGYETVQQNMPSTFSCGEDIDGYFCVIPPQ